jgi:hypothetical protein
MGIGRGLEILDTCAFQANPLLLSHPLLVSTSPPPRTSLGAGVPSAGVPGAVDTMLGMDGAATHLAGVRGAGMPGALLGVHQVFHEWCTRASIS